MTDKIHAPWTPEQVDALNRFQQYGGMHPFTCGNDDHSISVVLMARPDGWHCSDPACGYRQDWAHAFMANPDAWPKAPFGAPRTNGAADLATQAAYLRDQFAVLAAKAPVPLPTAEELAAGATADKVTAQRIHCARPGIPLHHVFAVLQALRAVRALDRAPNPDREDRIPLDQLTEADLELLYDDLDRYVEVVGELNEANTELAQRADRAQAETKRWLAFIERGMDTHMQFGVINPDGSTEQLPCADWCHACRVERAEAAIARVRAAVHIADDNDVTDWQRGYRACAVNAIRALDEPAPTAATQATDGSCSTAPAETEPNTVDGWTQQDDGTWTLPIEGGTILFTRRTTPEERARFAAAWRRTAQRS